MIFVRVIMKIAVKNLHKADASIPGGALNAWKRYFGITGSVVCVRCQNRFAKHGGHVIKANPNADKSWYIVPLCVQCNELKDDNPFFVPASSMVRVTALS